LRAAGVQDGDVCDAVDGAAVRRSEGRKVGRCTRTEGRKDGKSEGRKVGRTESRKDGKSESRKVGKSELNVAKRPSGQGTGGPFCVTLRCESSSSGPPSSSGVCPDARAVPASGGLGAASRRARRSTAPPEE